VEQVRIGVVGVGGMGSSHARKLKEVEEAVLTCVCDINPETARAVGTETGVPWFTDYRHLVDSKKADAVIVATPHWVHPDIAVYAMEKGLHVLSEKPIAVTVSGADRMVNVARRKKRVFAVMHQRRFEPAIHRAIEMVTREGILGEVRRTLCVDPWFRSQAYYDSASWRATWQGEGGGVTLNQAPHDIDLFLKFGGLPSAVRARTRARFHRIEVEDEADAVLEYENGSWGYYYTTTNEALSAAAVTMEIVGEKGKLRLYGDTVTISRFDRPITQAIRESTDMWAKNNETPVPIDVPQGKGWGGHMAVVRNFCRAILYGEELLSPGEEGRWTVEFINAIIWSGRTGRTVKLPVSRRRYDAFIEKLKAASKPKEGVREQRVTDPTFTQ